MKWPLHPIAPSTEVLVNPLAPAMIDPMLNRVAKLATASSGIGGHAAGVPVAQPARPRDAGYDVACASGGDRVAQVR